MRKLKHPIPRKSLPCKNCGELGTDKYYYTANTGIMYMRCSDCYSKELLHKCKDCDNYHIDVSWSHLFIDTDIYIKYPGIEKKCYNCGYEHYRNTEPRIIFNCVVCNKKYFKGETGSSGDLCTTCAALYTKCTKCETQYTNNLVEKEILDIKTGAITIVKDVCATCFNTMITRCSVCMRNLVKHQGTKCPECQINTNVCDLCNKDTHIIDLTSIQNLKICKPCYTQRVGNCPECGDTVLDKGYKYHHHRVEEHKSCRKCIGSPVMDYNFKPKPIFFGQGVLYYGIENEYEFTAGSYRVSTDTLRNIYAKDNLRYFVHDGSLNYGIEMIFNPMTFDYFSGIQEPLTPEVSNLRGDTAGCHVHMSKDAFTTFHMFKFLNLLTKNVTKFYPIFQRHIGEISPRTGKQYCEKVPCSNGELARTRYGNRKYWWINLKNTDTIEIRIFKAARNSSELQSIIQSLDALYYYTKDNSHIEQSFEGYLKFLNQKQYEQACKVFEVGAFNTNKNYYKKEMK